MKVPKNTSILLVQWAVPKTTLQCDGPFSDFAREKMQKNTNKEKTNF